MRRSPRAAAAGWFVFLAGAGLVLHLAGSGDLAPPPLVELATWAAWLDAVGPFTAAFAVVRLLAFGMWWYLLATTLCGVVLRLAGADGLLCVVDRFTLPALRRLLATAVTGITLSVPMVPPSWAAGPPRASTGLAATTTSSTTTTTTATVETPTATMTMTKTPMSSPDMPHNEDGSTLTMRLLPPASDPVPGWFPPADDPAPGRTNPKAAGDAPSTSSSWTVSPGESFWSRAEAMAGGGGEGSSDDAGEAEVAAYWLRLIEANRSRLTDPANPDLIFPGQVFLLPR